MALRLVLIYGGLPPTLSLEMAVVNASIIEWGQKGVWTRDRVHFS